MEKKKNVTIGVLLAIIFLLIGFIVAMMIMVKGKENSDNDNKSTSTSISTSSITSSTTSKIINVKKVATEFIDELNKKLAMYTSPLEKKYNLKRKYNITCGENWDDGCEFDLDYYYNDKIVFGACLGEGNINDLIINMKGEVDNDDIFIIKEIKDSKNNDIYYLVFNHGTEEPLFNKYITNKNFERIYELEQNNIFFIEQKNGQKVYDGLYYYEITNSNKQINYITLDTTNEMTEYHQVIIENGKVKDTVTKRDSFNNYEIGYAG